MPEYEVVRSPGLQFPVGHTFKTDELHPSMRQHVKELKAKGKREPEVVEVKDDNGHSEPPAKVVDPKAAKATKATKVEPPAKVVDPADGPGENS